MSVGLRALIVDDEAPAREKLRRFLSASPSVSSIFEARNGAQAIDIARAEHPDVVFLDIGMPHLDGVTVAERLVERNGPFIVFVTAYDEHAVRAFELGAVDYLLKPFDRTRFDAALARAEAALAGERVTADIEKLKDTLRSLVQPAEVITRLLVEDGDRRKPISLATISRFDADRNYIRVYTTSGVFRVRMTMNELERRLPSKQFVRINRSQLINLDCVLDFTPAGHGDFDVRMQDGTTVRLSRRYRDRLEHVI